MRTISQINADLENLWSKTFDEESNAYAPLPHIEPQRDAIVFVGMNPSFSLRGWNFLLNLIENPNVDPNSFFQWPRPNNYNEQLAHQLEALARKYYPFFAPHKELAGALGLPWEHIDLFAYRETNQAEAKRRVLANVSQIQLTQFGKAQFQLFEEVLSLAQPKAVVVINALASQIYRSYRELEFDSATGLYRDKALTKHACPVFFSGMLTGAHALDRFSKERLFWHIARALGKTWQPDT